jgi:hypothetical protein
VEDCVWGVLLYVNDNPPQEYIDLMKKEIKNFCIKSIKHAFNESTPRKLNVQSKTERTHETVECP